MNATPSPVAYTVWTPPGALFPIRYSLALFREIEFFVGEGYRRIPHGGLEVGAVLYGHGEPAELTLHAFRPIESQHSFGPSFTLSPSDLEQLGKQAAKPLITESGEELEAVGWLISNCRSDLVLTEQESRIYDEYFPGPRQVTLLAKPEKFKPTRYGFLARPPRGGLVEKACRDSFILPLSMKGEATTVRESLEETPVPARPAPAPLLATPVMSTPASPPAAVLAAVAEVAPTPALDSSLHSDIPTELAHSLPEPVVKPVIPGPPLPTPPLKPPAVREPRPTLPPQTVAPASPAEQALVVSADPLLTEAKDSSAPLAAGTPSQVSPSQAANAAATSANLPAGTTENVTRSVRERTPEKPPESLYPARSSILMLQSEPQATKTLPEGPTERLRERRQPASASSWRQVGLGVAILAILAAAAIWTYLRLPAPPIPLNAEIQPGQVVVTWSPELTKSADRCAITTWINGQPSSQALSADEQSEGEVTIQTSSPDATIQLHAQHWYQERTGQIRVFRIIPPPPPPVVPKPVRRVFALPQGASPVPPIVGRPADPAPQTPPQ
jgi:hypothetical protein